MFFELLCGTHVQNGKSYKKGAVIESNSDLTTIFKNRFKKIGDGNRVYTGNVKTKPNIILSPPPEKTDKGQAENAKPLSVKLGKNITSKFPSAKDAGVKVFIDDAKWCSVVDEKDNAILSPKKLRKKDVTAFLDDLVDSIPNDDDLNDDDLESEN